MRDISKSLRGSAVTISAGIMVLYGFINLVAGGILIMFFSSTFLGLSLSSFLYGGLYMGFGFGVLDRRQWAFYGAIVLVPILLAIYLRSFMISWILDDLFSSIMNLIHITLHSIILAAVIINYDEFTWKPKVPAPLGAELVDYRTMGLRCENCKSENLTIFPDGSGRCNDCLHMFKNIWESTTGISD